MTREKAIKILSSYKNSYFGDALHGGVISVSEIIELLSAQPEPCEDAVKTITEASFTGKDGLDYVETLVALNALKMQKPERRRGRWIVTSEFEDCRYVKCNQCKVTQVFYHNKPLTNFCPNCGADMMGDQNG